ncbi:hypothetical protein PTTG_27074 [Puccinia triticina 1-1 BBBD Race 1]|uniref:Uncharacterized protein n=1 Tax=Puccinia triticina (isolate 1-1 / race 1 (BBBD)) TaxID=630390 RepID=A0A180GQI6_PUCT1|nr:hypothetical protein PTTG_27074 [Puccinia triticina 1-1 BBBD Race 1]
MHLMVIVNNADKPTTPAKIISVVTAEIPDEKEEPNCAQDSTPPHVHETNRLVRQLLAITDTEAIIQAANKAKRLAKASSSKAAPGPSDLDSTTPGPLIAPTEPQETSSCPASLASSFTLPPAIGFQAPPEPSLFSAAPADPPNVQAWDIIPPNEICPPPPPSGPIYLLILAPLALPPPERPRPPHKTMSAPDPSNTIQTALHNLIGPPPPAGPSTSKPVQDNAGLGPDDSLTQTPANPTAEPAVNTAPPAPPGPTDRSIMGIFAEMQRMTLQMQQANFDARLAAEQQAREDRNRLRQLEEAVTKVLVTLTKTATTALPRDGRIDLQRFRTLDGLVFTGPFQDIEVFLTWIYGLEIFFGTKAVTLDSDKIRIAGPLIKETNLLSFYSNKAANYLTRTWVAFKEALFTTALPLRWRQEIKGQIRNLRMAERRHLHSSRRKHGHSSAW